MNSEHVLLEWHQNLGWIVCIILSMMQCIVFRPTKCGGGPLWCDLRVYFGVCWRFSGRFSGASVALQWRFSGASVALQWRFSGRMISFLHV